jgi:hypothetical protein
MRPRRAGKPIFSRVDFSANGLKDFVDLLGRVVIRAWFERLPTSRTCLRMFDTRRSAMERNLSALPLVAMVFSSLMGEVMGVMPRVPLPQRQAAHHEPNQSAQHPSLPRKVTGGRRLIADAKISGAFNLLGH